MESQSLRINLEVLTKDKGEEEYQDNAGKHNGKPKSTNKSRGVDKG